MKQLKSYCIYIKSNGRLGALLLAVICLFYGKQAYSTAFYVDAEEILNHARTIYNWDQIGRFGLIFLKYIVGGNWYNPYLAAALFIVCFWLVGMTFTYILWMLKPQMGEATRFVSAGIFLVHPTYAEQFTFRFQAFEVAFAMLLILLAGVLFTEYLDKRNAGLFVTAVILEIWAFGIYQSMANLMLCVYVAIYLLTVDSREFKQRKRLVLLSIVQFITAFVIYEIIVKLFFNSGTYLTGQVGWLSGDIAATVRSLLAYIKHVLLFSDVFYPVTYCICVVASFAFVVLSIVKKKKVLPNILGYGTLLLSPFFLAFVTGTPTVYRAQCMLPFVCAVIVAITITKLMNKGYAYAISVVLAFVLLICQGAPLARLFYSQDIIRQQDELVSMRIMSELDKFDTSKPIVFLGKLEAKGDASCYSKNDAETFLCYSVYELAYMSGAKFSNSDFYNTARILEYYRLLGADYTVPDIDLVRSMSETKGDGPVWPTNGSITEENNCIIVRLSK